jgi:hypothetical protein
MVVRCASNMGSGFFHPSRRITVTDQVKKPPEESETIAFS